MEFRSCNHHAWESADGGWPAPKPFSCGGAGRGNVSVCMEFRSCNHHAWESADGGWPAPKRFSCGAG